jgi:hypothetical protein
MCVCVHVCMYVCMYIYIYIYLHIPGIHTPRMRWGTHIEVEALAKVRRVRVLLGRRLVLLTTAPQHNVSVARAHHVHLGQVPCAHEQNLQLAFGDVTSLSSGARALFGASEELACADMWSEFMHVRV